MTNRCFSARQAGGPAGYVLALLLVTLCSCQALPQRGERADTRARQAPGMPVAANGPLYPQMAGPAPHFPSPGYPVHQASYLPPSLPPGASTGAPAYGPAGACPPYQPGASAYGQAAGPAEQWRPPGIPGPWPAEEYLFDGGDRGTEVQVLPDWSVHGLDQEDTVVHYDTLDGRLVVEPTNRVQIYSPRFAAVRKVYGPASYRHHDRLAGVEQPLSLSSQETRSGPTTAIQPVQAVRYMGIDGPLRYRDDVRGAMLDGTQGTDRVSNNFRSLDSFHIIRHGKFDNSEKARLSASLDAALAWSSDQAVQVTINAITASYATNDSGAQSVYHYELPPGKPRLRVVKVASKKEAKPGEEIEFAIRFDNVGDQPLGNITIVDNLTTRLEYVADSAECTVQANFLTQKNDGESLVLRWEIPDPLAVGQGGIIRFRCHVR